MERLFVISEISSGYGQPSQQVLQSIVQQFQPVIIFVKDFATVSGLANKHPAVTWIVVDYNCNRDWLVNFFSVIPAPNYIINFSGSNFAQTTLRALSSCGHEYTERERGQSELSFFGGLVKSTDAVNCTVFINVVEKRSSLEKRSHGVSKAVGKFVKGAKSTLSNLVDDSDDDSEECQPLLQQNPVQTPDESSFLRSLFSCCCPCISGPPELQYQFRTPEELHAYLRTEQTREMHKSLKKLHERLHSSYTNSISELRRKEEQKLEELQDKVEGLKEEEEKKLTAVADQQNKNTRTNLLGVLGEKNVQTIEQSRSRQSKGKAEYDADRALKEGKDLIRKQVQIDRAQLVQKHYETVLQEQLRKLTEIQRKYQTKGESLHARYFGNSPRA